MDLLSRWTLQDPKVKYGVQKNKIQTFLDWWREKELLCRVHTAARRLNNGRVKTTLNKRAL